jgi:chromosome segregation ATPase
LGPHVGFKARIKVLQEEQDRVRRELHEWKDKAEQEILKRQEVEGEVHRLLKRLQQANEEKETLELQVEQWKRITDHFHDSTAQCHERANRLLTALDTLRSISSSHPICFEPDISG